MGALAFVLWYWQGAYSSKRPQPFQPVAFIFDLVDDEAWFDLTMLEEPA